MVWLKHSFKEAGNADIIVTCHLRSNRSACLFVPHPPNPKVESVNLRKFQKKDDIFTKILGRKSGGETTGRRTKARLSRGMAKTDRPENKKDKTMHRGYREMEVSESGIALTINEAVAQVEESLLKAQGSGRETPPAGACPDPV